MVQLEQIRDFLILHYKANERGEPFWKRCRDMEIPESLARKLALFRAQARLFRYEDELFSDSSWIAVLLGQGVMPLAYDPLVDTVEQEQVRHSFARMASMMHAAAAAMPRHADYVARHCPAPGAAAQPVAGAA